jgi:hypothetical protein
MRGRSHKVVTSLAFDLVHSVTPLSFSRSSTKRWSADADTRNDMELVRVRGILGDRSRDDPHSPSLLAIDDRPSRSTEDILDISAFYPTLHWTALNHYIDIRKGAGTFDDFDGYSYHRGSAHRGQHEEAIPGVHVDEAIATGLSTSYVHAPGHRWYRRCSKAIRRYSRFADPYDTVEAEAKARFPRAGSRPGEGRGVPYSVFLPVDNMALFWFSQLGTRDAGQCAGFVLHALQDASVPHHAAGTAGNFHVRWERDQEEEVKGWVADPEFGQEVRALHAAWAADPSPAPTGLAVGDHTQRPGVDWRVDMLVTWMALNAYEAYRDEDGYHNFRKYKKGRATMRELAVKATAASMLALAKVEGELGSP